MQDLSKELSFLFASLDCSPVGVMLAFSENDNCVLVNTVCREIFDLSDDYARHGDCRTLLSGLNGTMVSGRPVELDEYPLLNSLSGQDESDLNFAVCLNGMQKVVSMQSSPILMDGALVGAVAIVLDITESYRLRDNLECATLRLENLWRLTRKETPSIKQICDITLEGIAEITKSTYGFYGFLDAAEENMVIHSWTGETMKGCSVVDKPFIYPVKDAGLWGEAIRQRRSLLINDYSSTEFPRRGLPEGHVKLECLMVIPHFIGNRIHSVAAVANKDFGYVEEDRTRITQFLMDVQTVIQRVEAETQLKNSEEKYRNLVETINDGVIALQHDYVVTFANKRICRLLNRDLDEILGCRFDSFVHESSLEVFIEQQSMRSKGTAEPYEMVLVDKAGKKKIVLSSPTPLWNEGGGYAGSYEVITDITNSKRLERQLLQSQKMETVGVLAAGIAHEINTPLQYIIGNAGFIKDAALELVQFAQSVKAVRTEDPILSPLDKVRAINALTEKLDIDFLTGELSAAIDDSIDGLNRIASIVQSIKLITHPCSDKMKYADINELINTAVTVARNEWKQYAELQTDLDESIPKLRCLPGDINQLILNLVVNAAHSLQEKKSRTGSKGLISITTTYDVNSICVSVADNGIGIPSHIKEKIFDPFFTTKDVGTGTGMGLAIVHKIVSRHGGDIWFESEEGKGTIFHVQFPMESSV